MEWCGRKGMSMLWLWTLLLEVERWEKPVLPWLRQGDCVLVAFVSVCGAQSNTGGYFQFLHDFSNTKSHSVFLRVLFGKFFPLNNWLHWFWDLENVKKKRELTRDSKGHFHFQMNKFFTQIFYCIDGFKVH